MNTHKYLDNFKVNDKFVEEAIKKCLFEENPDKDIIDRIRSLVFCGRNITTESVFFHIWTTIVERFVGDTI